MAFKKRLWIDIILSDIMIYSSYYNKYWKLWWHKVYFIKSLMTILMLWSWHCMQAVTNDFNKPQCFYTNTDHATPASARVQRNYKKLQIRKDDTAYVKTAKMGGHSGNNLIHFPLFIHSSLFINLWITRIYAFIPFFIHFSTYFFHMFIFMHLSVDYFTNEPLNSLY